MASSQPTHQDVIGALNRLCTNSVATIETQLENQKESDAVEAKKREEEEEHRREEERQRLKEEEQRKQQAQLDAARERLEWTRKIADEQLAIVAAERELEAKKRALSEAQKAAGNDEDDDDDDEGSESGAEEQPVRLFIMLSLYFILITIRDYIRGLRRRNLSVSKRKLEKGCRRRLTML